MDGALVTFAGAYRGRRVLVTGHTGFKGAWLCEWLLALGAEVEAIALATQTPPGLAEILDLPSRLGHHILDVRDGASLEKAVERARPEVVFHLAAQALVRPSYEDPRGTWEVNVGGTVNLLEAVRRTPSVRACVVVTSDKCYENREWHYAYREDDSLGGHDPYSSSKGAAELAVSSWRRSFFSGNDAARIATARAGNVIGGGDRSRDRIVVDFVNAANADRPLVLRSPRATRPWQHVLVPVSGYLTLAARLLQPDGAAFTEAWNFGPSDADAVSVETLTRLLVAAWGSSSVRWESEGEAPHEAARLRLDCGKALARLGWRSVWNVDEAVRRTIAWYRLERAHGDTAGLVRSQIAEYVQAARAAGRPWAEGPQ